MNETDELVSAAKAVSINASGFNVARLINAVMSLPFNQMPKEYLDQPIWSRHPVKNSVSDQLRFLTIVQDT